MIALYKEFHRLKVVSQVDGGWLCSCRCGGEIVVSGSALRAGSIRSCGCRKHLKGEENSLYKHGPWVSEFNRYKASANARSIEWSLTFDNFMDLVQKPCQYCGDAPSEMNYRDVVRNGIDRVENSIGYVLDNCVPCCGMCNSWKLAYSQEAFLNHVRKIHFHNEFKGE